MELLNYRQQYFQMNVVILLEVLHIKMLQMFGNFFENFFKKYSLRSVIYFGME